MPITFSCLLLNRFLSKCKNQLVLSLLVTSKVDIFLKRPINDGVHNLTSGLAAVVEDVYQNISTEYSQSALHELVAYIQDEDSSLHFLLDYVPAFITDYLPASRTGAGTNFKLKFMQILESHLTRIMKISISTKYQTKVRKKIVFQLY